jgi:hypothetical protein
VQAPFSPSRGHPSKALIRVAAMQLNLSRRVEGNQGQNFVSALDGAGEALAFYVEIGRELKDDFRGNPVVAGQQTIEKFDAIRPRRNCAPMLHAEPGDVTIVPAR